jgi:flagellar biosynthesis component FlhA
MTLFLVFFTFSVFLLFFIAAIIDKAQKKAKLEKEKRLKKQKEEMFDFYKVTKILKSPTKEGLEKKIKKFESSLERENTLSWYSRIANIGDIKKKEYGYLVRINIEKYCLKPNYDKKNLSYMLKKHKELKTIINNF